MKRFLLTMTAAASVLMASAQWARPTIESNEMSQLAVGEEVYLFNTGTQMFLNQGNANGVQASVAEEGLKVKVEKYQTEQDAQGEQPMGDTWTSSAEDFFGEEGVIKLEGLTFTLGDPNDGTTTWSWHEKNAGSLANHMPTTDGTVETLITEFSAEEPFGTLPTHGCFVKLEPTAKGKVTIAGKPSGGAGQHIVLVTADKSDPTKILAANVTPNDASVSSWEYNVDDAHVYYFFQLAEPNQIGSYRFTLRSVAFAQDAEVVEKVYVWDEKTYTIKDFNTIQNKWFYMYVDGSGGCYMNGGKPSDYLWELEAQENGTYRIHAAEANPTQNPSKYSNCYLGLEIIDGSLPNTIVHPFIDLSEIDEASEYCVEWAFVGEAVYTAYLEKMKVYSTAVRLKAAIDDCTAKGLDASSMKGVYDNPASTLEELQTALKQAEALASAEDEKNVTPDNPKDFTDRIANPNFDEGVAGWLCEYSGPKKNDIPKADPGWAPEMVEGVMMAPAVSMWLNNNTSHLWQVVEGLPNGIYEVSAGIWSDNNGPVFYANDAKVSVGKTGATRFALLAYVGDNTIEFGLTAPADGVQWYMADYFQLQYFGNGTEAYKKWVDETLAEGNIFSDQICYTPLKEAYGASFEVLQTATDQEVLVAEMPKFTELYEQIKANVAAYADYQALLEDAEKMVSEGGYAGDDFDVLSDYIGMDEEGDDVYPNGTAPYILKGTLDTEGIVAEREFLNTLIQNVLNNGDIEEGADVTAKLVNPNFNDGLKGWSYDTTLGKPVAGGLDANPNVERWNENFDFYQVVELPNGVYRVDAQAFYRAASNATAEPAWTEGTAEVLTSLYANTGETLVKNVFAEAQEAGFYKEDNAYTMADDKMVPNSMKTASEAFTAGLYENSVVGVVWDGKLRLGIRSLNASENDRWSIFDNFRLTYLGLDAEAVAECYDKTIAEVESLLNNADLTEELQASLLSAMSLAVDKADAEGTLATIAAIRKVMDNANASVTAIEGTPAQQTEPAVVGFYSMSGAKLSAPQKGINIVKYSNGVVKKVMMK
jgi:hypothetical protein